MGPSGAIDAGRALGKYAVQRELGRGSMGVVYLARDTSLQRDVAIKLLNCGLTADPRFEDWFRIEARSVAAIYHPSVVRVHAFDTLEGQLLIDMEYVAGGAFADVLAKRGVTAQETVRMALEMLDALACCHAAGIIHRDIKPSNILLDQRGAAKLSDFGLARILEHQLEASLRSAGSSAYFLGTPRYAPPEAWDGAAAGPAWDLYSLGMVMYEALAGVTPYRATTPLALIKEMAQSRIQPVRALAPHISEELGAFVDGLISPDPDRRGANAAEAAERLQAVPEAANAQGSSGPTVRMPLPAGLGRRKERRKPMAFPLSGSLLGFVAAFVLIMVVAAFVTPLVRPELGGEPIAGRPRATLSQIEASSGAIPDALTLPTLTHGDPPGRAFDVLLFPGDVALKGAALMTGRAGEAPLLLVRTDNALWSLRLAESDGVVKVDGDWAEYQGVSGSILRLGKISGSGRRIEDPEAWVFTIALTNDFNNAIAEETLTLTPSASAADTAFWLGVERAAFTPALLVNELIERRLPWAEAIEAQLPAMVRSRVLALPLNALDDPLVLDGRLDESWWRQAGENAGVPECVLPGRPWQSGSRMIVRTADDALLIGFQLPRTPPGSMGLRLAIGDGPAIPVSSSPRWRAEYREGQGIVSAESRVGSAWQCPWEFADAHTAGGWEAEVRVPLEGVLRVPRGQALQRIRLNGEVLFRDAQGVETTLAQWGYPDGSAIEHGAIVVLSGM